MLQSSAELQEQPSVCCVREGPERPYRLLRDPWAPLPGGCRDAAPAALRQKLHTIHATARSPTS